MGPVGNEACETKMMNIFAIAQVVGGCAAQEERCCGSSKECLASFKVGHNKRTNHYAQVMACANHMPGQVTASFLLASIVQVIIFCCYVGSNPLIQIQAVSLAVEILTTTI
jgi:hypothetical protein